MKTCPFCKGKVVYVEMESEIRHPELITCLGDCSFDIMNDDYNNEEGVKVYYDNLKDWED